MFLALSGAGLRFVLDSIRAAPSSPILFVVFMDRIWRRSRGEEGVWFGNLRVDVVLLASSSHDLQFTAECEAAWMKVSSSRSEAMVE